MTASGEQVPAGGRETTGPYLMSGLAALSVGAAVIHFAVTFEHFQEYVLYGVFFLTISWAQLIWPAGLFWRPPRSRAPRLARQWDRLWLSLGIAGNAIIVVIYIASRTTGLPFGPDLGHTESVGALDVVSCVLECALVAGCAALLWRPSLAGRPLRRRRDGVATMAAAVAAPALVIAVTTAVMTPGWAGSEGPAGMGTGSASGSSMSPASPGTGDAGTTDGLPDMKLYGSAVPPTAAQVIAAAALIEQTDASLARYQNIRAAFAAGYTHVLRTDGEEHLIHDRGDPAYSGLNPRDPSSLVYAIDVPHHAPILLGATYTMGHGRSGPPVGGSLTRWYSRLTVCRNGKPTIAGFGVRLRGSCGAPAWRDRYTAQMLDVWVVPYPGGVFSVDHSQAAASAAVRAVLNGT